MNGLYLVSIAMLSLACYSFVGWIAEEFFVLATAQKLENRGFLTGPFLPIYGIGAIAMILLVEPYVTNPFLVFVACVVVTSTIEYLGSLMLSVFFHVSLWDYHDQRFNVKGRICLRNSLLFGGLGLLLIYVLQPIVSTALGSVPHDVAIALAFALIGILVIDSANSFRSLAKVRPVLDELHGSLSEAHAHIEQRAVLAEHTVAESKAARRSAGHSTLSRLSRAFPHARSVQEAEQ